MKKQTLLKKRILALALSAAMVFAQADTYAVLAAETENSGEAVEYDDSQPALTEDLEAEELGTEETETKESETESVSDEAGENGSADASDTVGEPDAEGTEDSGTADSDTVDSGTADSDTVGGDDNGDGNAESSENAKETKESEETELPEEPSVEEPSEEESEDNIEEINEVEAEEAKESVNSGTINNISWNIDANGLLTIEGTGDYVSSDNLNDADYLPPWAGREDVKTAKVDVSGIKYTDSMFRDCKKLTSIDLSGLETNNVTDMGGMFNGCRALRSLDVSGFDTRNVTNMADMFSGCSVLKSLDVSGFDTRNVTNMAYMFNGCAVLKSLDVSGFDTRNVTNMGAMFYYCKQLSNLDVSGFDTGNVTNMARMFNGCFVLSSLDVSGFDTRNVTDMGGMFLGCHELKSLDVSGFDTRNVTDMGGMFLGSYGLSSLDVSGFDTRNVTDMNGMFSGCRGLSSLDVSGFDTRNVTDMNGMFSDCRGLSSLDVSGFDTGNVTDMDSMFYRCRRVGNLDVSGFDTSRVTNMRSMFSSCSGLTSLDLSSFDMCNVTSMEDMISGASSLTYICTPRNCTGSVKLPDEHKWYDEAGTEYTELPTNLSHSIVLYSNGYPGDGSGTKKVVFISGITIEDKTYDGTPISYTGTPVVKDSSGNTIAGVTLSASYIGTLADGSKYEKTTQPPSQAGNYTLSFDDAGSDSYIFSQASYRFSIKPVVLAITAPSASIKTGETLPELSSLTTSIEVGGLLAGDSLIAQPQLKYGADNIPTDVAGTYDIIPYGADAGNNYSINYVNGTLTITASGGTSGENPDKDPDKTPEIVYQGSTKTLTWTIDTNGKLTVKGSGNYTMAYDEDFGAIMPEWFPWADTIKSAEINISNITSTENMFYGCSNLESIDLTNLNTSKVEDMSYMFSDCYRLKTLDLSGFDTSRVTNMSGMFYYCGSLEELDLSSFNTSRVRIMESMFYDCGSLEELDVSGFNTSQVININAMFCCCYRLKTLDLSNFDTSKVQRMDNMFSSCESLESLDLSNFDTSKVQRMDNMFSNCESLESLDLSSFDTKNVENMVYMFSGCNSLKRLNLSSFDTGKVNYMSYMFERCRSLTSLDLSSFDTKNVEDMDCMFSGCDSLKRLNLSSFDTGKADSMSYMFEGCRSLTSLDLSSFDVKNVEYVEAMFENCNSLNYIRTPRNCDLRVGLPKGTGGTDQWYQALDTPCTTLPMGLSTSIDLYKNGYPGDGITKKILFISGISINDMVYNGQSAGYSGTAAAMDSDGNKITDVILSCSYTGILEDGTAYNESAQAPSHAGEYELVIKAESNEYSGQGSYSFRIKPRTVVISAESVSIDIGGVLPALTELSYTVSGLLPDDKLTVEPTLRYGKDNISTTVAERYAIIPSGALAGNNYHIEYLEGTLTVGDPDDDSSFETNERTDLKSLSCTIAPVKTKIYDGAAYEPVVRVTVTESGRKKTLAEGTDYRVLYRNNVDAGTGTVTVRGSGMYKGYVEAPITIAPKAVKKLKVVAGGIAGTISADDVNSGRISLPVYVYDAGKLLTRDKDYTLSYDAFKKGTLTVKVKGMDGSNYTGESKTKVTVYEGVSADHIINPDNVTLQSYTAKYTGKAVKPVVKVMINGDVISNKNYKVQYQNNKDAGTAYVIVTGKGSYKGRVVTAFEITVDTHRLNISNTIKAQTYNGKFIKPSVTVKAGNKKLTKNKDYVVTYKNNLHAGTATITVTGKGNYSGTATKTFTINPQKSSKISVKGTWKDSNGDGVKDGGALRVTYGKRLLKEEVDYTLEAGEIKNNKIKVTIKAANGSDFTDSVVKTLKME